MLSKDKALKMKSRSDLFKPRDSKEPSTEPKYLSVEALPLYTHYTGTYRSTVPPISPKDLIFDYSYEPLPKNLPKVSKCKLPYVRDIGVRACIDKLGEYFRCPDYKLNLIQFWFLDIVTDCLWRAQDEFQFPEKYQKIILEWVLFIFNLIRAPEYNLSRKNLFKLFKEAMLLAEDYIQTGCDMVPLPEELFAIPPHENLAAGSDDLDKGSNESSSTISLESDTERFSYVAIKFEEDTEYFKLPGKHCVWNIDGEYLSSSEETMSEDERELPIAKGENDLKEVTEEEEEIEYYKADMSTPPRFKPSRESTVESISLKTVSDKESIGSNDKNAIWTDVPRYPHEPCTYHAIELNNCLNQFTEIMPEEKQIKSKPVSIFSVMVNDDDILKTWHDFYLWKKREQDMADPNVGWSTYSDQNFRESIIWNDPQRAEELKREWLAYIHDAKDVIQKMEENVFINTCVLLAIKQFVFESFYETFQYTLIRLAFRPPHTLITQALAENWHYPKMMRSELKKPKPKKPKKEKKQKEKKKKEKKPKEKSKDKSSKKSGKPKKEKKEKKQKPKPLTKEEKAELARLKREEAMLMEQRRVAEINRLFMFPLTDAATDEFFHGIFENWVKEEKGKKGTKDKKDKRK